MHYRYEERWLSALRWEQAFVPEFESRKPDWDEGRPTAELIKELFDLRPLLPDRKPLPEPEDEAQAYLIDKLRDAGATVQQLQQEVFARAQLQDESVSEVDYQISRAAVALEHFHFFGVGYNTGIDMRRAHLERELSHLRKERRATLLKTWQDIAELRKEFREAVAEYTSLLGRLGLL